MLRHLAALLNARPAAVLAIALALSFSALVVVVDFREGRIDHLVDPSIDRISKAGTRYDEKVLLAALRFETLFSKDSIRELRDFIAALESMESVGKSYSLANAIRVDSSMGYLDVQGALDSLPADDAAARALGKEILASPLYRSSVSGDQQATLIALTPAPDRELDIEAIRAAAAEHAPDATLLLTGTYVAEREMLPLMVRNLQYTIPMALLALTLVATLTLRSFRGVVLAIGANTMATLFTLGLIVLLGWKLNIVTVITPAVIFVVGFAYAVHVLTEFDHQLHKDAEGLGPRAAVARAVNEVAPPLALTALTTCAGFLSLMLSRITAILEFGVICAVGVAIALVTALLVLPAALVLWPPPALRQASGREYSRFNDRWAQRLAAFAQRRRTLILGAGALITFIAAVGVVQIRSNTDFLSNFNEDAPVRRDFEALNRDFAAGFPVELEVRALYEEAFLEPKNLHTLSKLQDALSEQPEVGNTTSISDYVSFVYANFGGPSEPGAIPKTKGGVDELLLAAPEGARRFVDSRRSKATVRVQLQQMPSAELLEWVRQVEAQLAETLPEHLKAQVVGNTIRVAATVEELTRGQVASIALAMFTIFVVLALLFQSARAGFLALIPNAIPIAVYFGALGLLGIPLNVMTALVACAVLGIAVDDSIHFLTRFNEAARAQADERGGVEEALRHTLRPVTVTSAALVAGFLALATSELPPQVEFGLLAAFTLALAWLLDITFTPALCGKLRFVTLWDSLTLDLGEAPNDTIGLFKNMSARQARIAASLGVIRALKAGERLVQRGDPGGSLFVVLDGLVEVSLPTEGGHQKIGVISRGELLGETAIFRGQRTANADAKTDVRLLRLSRDCLDRIQRRHPRVAAPLLRNLSEIMAEHAADNMERLAAARPK